MKNDKKVFFLIEAVLGIMVVVLAFLMLQEKNGKDLAKVSIILQNSEDNQWAGFKYGLKMAAEDHGIEMSVVTTEGAWNAADEMDLIEAEIEHGADAVIVQPAPGAETEKALKKIQKKVPVMLVGSAASEERDDSELPVTEPDHYAMGAALAQELLNDYNGNISGKTIGILSETKETEAAENREQGFREKLEDSGAEISWSVSGSFGQDGDQSLSAMPKVDVIAALDDNSLTEAGKNGAANDLHGALVYGIGHSMEAFYYLDVTAVECLVVPDEFNMGYQSLTQIAERLRNRFYHPEDQTISYTVIRKETMFTKENQEILFTMS